MKNAGKWQGSGTGARLDERDEAGGRPAGSGYCTGFSSPSTTTWGTPFEQRSTRAFTP